MFEAEWAEKKNREIKLIPRNPYPIPKINKAMLVHWEEHCLECAPPNCYNTCPLYEARLDHKCKNFAYGINRIKNNNSLLGYGAIIKFKKWGKLQTKLTGRFYNLKILKFIDFLNNLISYITKFITKIFNKKTINLKFSDIIYSLRYKLLRKNSYNDRALEEANLFFFSCYSYENFSYKFILEADEFKHSFKINPGWNNFYLKISSYKELLKIKSNSLINLYPENDLCVQICITWLDFINVSDDFLNLVTSSKKIKCVAWDLDNTLWDGVFIEKAENVKINQNLISIIKQLNKCGIMNVIVSKNNDNEIIPFLKEKKIFDLFVYHQINWEKKSSNLKFIADIINIGIDSFAFVDDSLFEIEEARSTFPCIKTYNPKEAEIKFKNFDQGDINSNFAEKRIQFYKDDIKRNLLFKQKDIDFENFLNSCELSIKYFLPVEKTDITRCFELLTRTNQLNISARHYSQNEYLKIIENPNIYRLAFDAKDRFGHYGTIAYLNYTLNNKENTINIIDFVISCRIAKKFVEKSIIFFLKNKYANQYENLIIEYKKTSKNINFLNTFESLSLKVINEKYLKAKFNELNLEGFKIEIKKK